MKRWCVLWLPVSLLTTFSIFGQESPLNDQADQFFTDGKRYYENDQMDSALIQFDKAILAYKNNKRWEEYFDANVYYQTIQANRLVTDSLINVISALITDCQEKLGNGCTYHAQYMRSISYILMKSGKYQEALQMIEKSIKALKSYPEPNPNLEANIYRTQGVIHTRLRQENKAKEILEKALDILSKSDKDDQMLRVSLLTDLGTALKNMGNYEEALNIYKEAENICLNEDIKVNRRLSPIYNGMGIIYAQTSRYPQAMKYFSDMMVIDQQFLGPDHQDLAVGYTNLGILNELMGDYVTAIDFHHKSLNLKLKHYDEDNHSLSYDYRGLSMVYGIIGDSQQSIIFLKRSIDIIKKTIGDDAPDLISLYSGLGQKLLEQNQVEEALNYFEQALQVYEKDPVTEISIGQAYFGKSKVYASKKDWDSAIEYGYKSLEANEKIYSEVGFYPAQDHRLIGSHYLQVKNFEKAEEHFRNAIKINETIYGIDNHNLAPDYQQLANVYFESGDLKESTDLIQKALILSGKTFDSEKLSDNPSAEDAWNLANMIDILGWKGTILHQRFKKSGDKECLSQSLLALETAIDYIDLLKISYKGKGSFTQIRQNLYYIFHQTVQTLYDLYETEKSENYISKAYQVIENSKATLLLASIQETKARKFGNVPPDVLEKENLLRRDLYYNEQQLIPLETNQDKKDNVETTELRGKIFALKTAYDSLVKEIETKYPEYYHLKYSTKETNLDYVQQNLLNDDEVALEYFLSDSILYLLSIARDQVKFKRITPETDLKDHILEFRDLITNKNYDVALFSKTAFKLKNLLIPEDLDIDQWKHLIIIPDDVLNYLPFEVLNTTSVKNPDFYSLPYLIRTHSVSYAPNLTLYQKMVEKELSDQSLPYLAFVPEFGNDLTDDLSQAVAFNQPYREKLARLDGALKEATEISKIIRGHLLQGSAANESAFKNQSSEYGIIHLATHAIVDNLYPMNSRLLFASESDSIEDGNLYVWELYNMQLNAEMAVLSACNTGVGKFQAGEGVMSLGRAFLYAGCPSTIMSLWPAQDETTAGIMTGFFEELSDAKSKDEALRQAKMKFIERADPLFSHPYYWAGFVAQGNTQPLHIRSNSNYIWLWAGLGVIVLLGLLFVKNRKQVAA